MKVKVVIKMANEENFKDVELQEHFKVMKIIEGRNKIILHNNNCIIETIAFYEHILLNDIINPFLFSENYDINLEIKNIISDRLSFMDRFKIVCKIARTYNIARFKQFDDYIKMRNRIAHNLSSVININIQTKESQVFFAGEEITWNQYMEELDKWAQLSSQMAKFILNVFKNVNLDKDNAVFPYCKVEGHCALVQHNLIYPEVNGEYTSFFKTGFNMDLLDYVNEEQKYINDSNSNKKE